MLLNGTVITVDRAFSIAEGVAIAGDRVLTTGNDPHDVTLVAGVNYTTADFGFRPVSSIGDKVWTDR